MSTPGEFSTLVRPAAEPLLTALGERESFDLADALAALERPGAIPRERLAVQTVETLASLMQVGVLSEAAPAGGLASPLPRCVARIAARGVPKKSSSR